MLRECYDIIIDEPKLLEFIEWLPELEEGEEFYVSLFARKKYAPEIVGFNNDKQQLKRFSATKTTLLRKIQQLEIPLGRYTHIRPSGEVIECPQKALAIYIGINPRSNLKAANVFAKTLVDVLAQQQKRFPVHRNALTALHNSKSRSLFIDFDFDLSDKFALETTLRTIEDQDLINPSAITILKTRGGFHILVENEKVKYEYKNKFYQGISALEGCDVQGDNLIPIPGCYQGGFVPYFY